MKTEGIYLPNYSSWRQIVSAWEEGKMRRAEPVYKRRKFGCEFEFTGITRREAVNALMRTGYFRSRSHIGGGLDKYILIDRRNRKFEIVKDASIEANGSDQQVEFVTGILSFDDMNMLSNCLKAIRNAGGKVNSSCGMHVHVSADDYASGSKLRNLLLYTAGYQKLFYEAFKVPVKRQRYCKVSFGNMLTKLERTPNPTVAQIRSIWYEGNPDTSSHYNKSRYAIINLHSFFQGKGIEIRLFNGTLNTEQTKANIIFSCAMVEYAAHLKYQANLDYIHSTKEQQRKAMLFLLQEMDCRSLFLNNMVKNNMQ